MLEEDFKQCNTRDIIGDIPFLNKNNAIKLMDEFIAEFNSLILKYGVISIHKLGLFYVTQTPKKNYNGLIIINPYHKVSFEFNPEVSSTIGINKVEYLNIISIIIKKLTTENYDSVRISSIGKFILRDNKIFFNTSHSLKKLVKKKFKVIE
jgi:nucleoid DNA-binding protein